MIRLTTYSSDFNSTTIDSYLSGVVWKFYAPLNVIVSGVSVQDSYNYGNEIDATDLTNTDRGNNTGWNFGITPVNINLDVDNLVFQEYSISDFIKQPIISNIYNTLITNFSGIAYVQQEDLSKATLPLINTYIDIENCNNRRTTSNAGAYNNIIKFIIRAYDKLDEEDSNSKFTVREKLFNLYENIKGLIYSGIYNCQEIRVTNAVIYEDSSDILKPSYLEITVDANYTQDNINTNNNAYV